MKSEPNDLIHSFAATRDSEENHNGLTKREYFAIMSNTTNVEFTNNEAVSDFLNIKLRTVNEMANSINGKLELGFAVEAKLKVMKADALIHALNTNTTDK